MGEFGAHLLLGHADAGELILMVGPEYGTMQQRAAEAGIKVRDASCVRDVQTLKVGLALSGRSLALIASTPEVEGVLDRTAFGPGLTGLAHAADRVLYFGASGAVLVHPVKAGTRLEVHGGVLRMHQHLDVVSPGETVVGLTVDRIG